MVDEPVQLVSIDSTPAPLPLQTNLYCTQATMKILMLHGYAQTGDTFRRKIHRLESRILGSHPKAEFIYLDAPNKLETHDIPGLGQEQRPQNNGDNTSSSHDMRAWFDLRIVQNPPTGLNRSLDMLAEVLKEQGPFDGIIAFSQGTVVGAMLASLLQGATRHRAYELASLQTPSNTFAYPTSFLHLRHPPLKFALCYASRVGTGSYSDWMYESPRLETPFCHFFGKWDPMVSFEEREAVLKRLCEDGECPRVFVHGGGHFVPNDQRSTEIAVGFVEMCMRSAKEREEDSGVEL